MDPRKIVAQQDMLDGEWRAWRDGSEDYDLNPLGYVALHRIGHGKTREEAEADLREQENEQ